MDRAQSLFIVDGHALAYRAYFAFIRNPLVNSKGENTSAVFGFTRMMLLLLRKYRPRYLAVVFDSPEETSRHREFPDYKAHRPEMPDAMAVQIPVIMDVVRALNVKVIVEPGLEADDIIATLAKRGRERGRDVKIITADKDFFQLLSDHIHIIRPEKGTGLEDEIGPVYTEERFGLPPASTVDLLALMGDTSDNIPGVKGIGEKTAIKLLTEFGSLDAIYERLDEVMPEHVREKLKAGRESAYLSRQLVTLKEVPIALSLDDLTTGEPDAAKTNELFLRLEFHQMLREISLQETSEGAAARYGAVDETGLPSLASRLAEAQEIAIEVVSTGGDPMRAELVGIALAAAEGEASYASVAGGAAAGGLLAPVEGRGIPIGAVREALGALFADRRVVKICHDMKSAAIVLEAHGLEIAGPAFDTMVASYCLDPERRSHSLEDLSLEFLRRRAKTYADLFAAGDRIRDIRSVPQESLARYACEGADDTLRLKAVFDKNLRGLGFTKLFEEVEMPLLFVLKRMEQEGVAIDRRKLEDLSATVTSALARLTERIHAAAGEEFNIKSSKQIQRILFEKLGLRTARRTKTGYSTDEDVLTELASKHTIAALILEHRQLSKMKGTYIDALPRLVNTRTGRIHTSFNQTVTATGRLSSSDPNLQNIPIRTGLGRDIRAAFIPREGNVLLDADYSQIELRIMAHLSKDRAYVETFREGGDIHTRTAARIFGVPESKVDPEMRARAKTINFGVIYGMGPRGLALQLGIPLDEAKRFIDEYFATYPGVKAYIDRTVAEARTRLYAETLLGRRRFIPEITSDDSRIRGFCERIAVNMPIQGTAADMIKIAMIRIDGAIRERDMRSRMILQVHDELVFDMAPAERPGLEALVRESMESALALEVPVRVDMGTGRNWLEAHA
jgi:DNA polymerase-1